MPRIAGVSHLELSVTDVRRSSAWYQRVLGLQELTPLTAADWGPAQVTTLLHPDAGFVVGLVEHASGEGQEFSEHRTGLDHFSFAVDSRAALEEWVDQFEECGVEHSPINDQPYGSIVVFRDPDNIQLELFYTNFV
jgi:catechol 2,3-dioxygenase-like lactoylglutathione lyase family enzyme